MKFALFFLLALPCAFLAQAPAVDSEQSFMIAGRVIDAQSGTALSGAEVAIAPVAHRDRLTSVFTTPQGLFSFAGLTKGKYVLQAARNGFGAESYLEHLGYSTAIAVGPGLDSVHINFPLHKPGAIFGNITDQDGEPVPNAQVYVYQQQVREGRRGTWMVSLIETNNEGRFRISKLRPGTYFIAVTAHPWYARNPQQLGPQTATADDQSLDVAYPATFYPETRSASESVPIQVQSGSSVEADVVLTSIPAARVQLRVPSGARIIRAHFEVATDWATNMNQSSGWWGDGSQPNSVAPGTYRMIAQWEDSTGRHSTRRVVSVNGDTTLDVASDDELDVTANLIQVGANGGGRGPSLALRNVRTGVLVRGQPAGNGRINWGGGELMTGRYELVVTDSDTYIKSIAMSGGKVSGRTVEIPASGKIELNVSFGAGLAKVEGTVEQEQNAIGGALVLLLPDQLASNTSLIRRDQSDSDGTFTFRNVVPGRYTLLALPPGMEEIEYVRPQAVGPYLSQGQRLAIEPSGTYRVEAKLIAKDARSEERVRPANTNGITGH